MVRLKDTSLGKAESDPLNISVLKFNIDYSDERQKMLLLLAILLFPQSARVFFCPIKLHLKIFWIEKEVTTMNPVPMWQLNLNIYSYKCCTLHYIHALLTFIFLVSSIKYHKFLLSYLLVLFTSTQLSCKNRANNTLIKNQYFKGKI